MITIFFGNGNFFHVSYDPADWTDYDRESFRIASLYRPYDLRSTLPLSQAGLWLWYRAFDKVFGYH